MTMDLEARAEALVERYSRPAILLHRPYPAHSARTGNSHFGGLPSLPPGTEWPRTRAGVPLHFLCQVDCGEIDWKTELPDCGILYFFGRDDEEQIWESEDPNEDCRVLYAPAGPDSFGETPPPSDLPPIGWGYPRRAFPELALAGEPAERLHHRWPILPLAMDTFPDQGGLPEAVEHYEESGRRFSREVTRRVRLRRFWPWLRLVPPAAAPALDEPVWDRYGELLPLRRARAFEEATGIEVVEDDPCEMQFARGQAIFADETFPQHWIFIHLMARVALCRGRPAQTADDPGATEFEARIDAQARAWFDRSCEVAPETPVDEADRRDFRAWVGNLELRPGKPSPGHRAASWAFTAAIPAIRSWAGDRDRAALISPRIYEAMADFFHSIHLQHGAEKDWYTFQLAQMLGLPPASQQPVSADDPAICLLNLASDAGLGWSFGDAGEATFWISPGDLAAKDFSRVRGVIDGH
ncbi:MAG TPA: DUF1963 domain-containing protein [Allosphingosinicella sp.]|jgi:uncharacterized protein YwqG